MFPIINQMGQLIQCEVLHIFSKNEKNYIIYVDESDNILASLYQQDVNTIILYPITDENDFKIAEEELKRCHL